MKPKYDFSIPSGGDIHLQCTINNPESLLNVTKGGLILKKDETTISGQGTKERKCKLIFKFIFLRKCWNHKFIFDTTSILDVSHSNFTITWSKLSGTKDDSGRYICIHSGYPDPVSVSVYVTVLQPGRFCLNTL